MYAYVIYCDFSMPAFRAKGTDNKKYAGRDDKNRVRGGEE